MSDSAFAQLDAQGHLINALHKGATKKAGRTGFRGDFALIFTPSKADEKRPPELTSDQVMASADGDKIDFYAGYLHSFESLSTLSEVVGPHLAPGGKFFAFCNNIDLLSKFTVELNGITYFVLPIDEATVYNELLELLYLDKTDLKKLDTSGKLDAVANAAAKFTPSKQFKAISYEDGLKVMGPVRNRNANRPV